VSTAVLTIDHSSLLLTALYIL